MEPARPLEVNTPAYRHHLLIATQGSDFKNAVVDSVIVALKQDSVYIKVTDVSTLPQIDEKDWSAIVILHTWENWKPQKDADVFIKRFPSQKKVIVVSTSGSGTQHLKGTDGLSAASRQSEIQGVSNEIVTRVRAVLTK